MSARRPVHPAWWLSGAAIAVAAWSFWSAQPDRPWLSQAEAVPNPAEQRLELIRELRLLRAEVEQIGGQLERGIVIHFEEAAGRSEGRGHARTE
ncbi:MAG: hypothetical protein RIG82_06805 [Phycisphaeraceae bacterium]